MKNRLAVLAFTLGAVVFCVAGHADEDVVTKVVTSTVETTTKVVKDTADVTYKAPGQVVDATYKAPGQVVDATAKTSGGMVESIKNFFANLWPKKNS